MQRPNARKSELDLNPSMDSVKSLHFKQNPSSKISKHQSKSNLLSISIFASTLSIVFCFVFIILRHKNPESRKFGIIIDGGSTGSRVHVFEYRIEGGMVRFDFGPNGLGSMRVNPGLSWYADHPDQAGTSLVGLLEFAKRRVPKEFWGETEVRLMATAGLRLLDGRVQERILQSCLRVLGNSGFKFQDGWASVITGSDEGLYAWVVANYALGTLGGDPRQTTGIIELGGASAQVTFVASEPVPAKFSRSLEYGNKTYNLYSNSLLHYGQNVAFDLVRESLVSSGLTLAAGSQKELILDPCTPTGYARDSDIRSLSPGSLAQKYGSTFHARGNFTECRAVALTLLQKGKENCTYQRCAVGSTFMPRLHGRFLATENFFYTSKFFGLAPKAILSDLVTAGQQFGEEEWYNIKRKHSSLDEEDLLRYCFSSAYIVALLHDSLGFKLDDARIGYTNQVENIPLDWALGAFIIQTTSIMNQENPGWITHIVTDDSPSLLMLLVALIIFIFVAWFISKWSKKAYLKTIYDLEKGRYIVTRISR